MKSSSKALAVEILRKIAVQTRCNPGVHTPLIDAYVALVSGGENAEATARAILGHVPTSEAIGALSCNLSQAFVNKVLQPGYTKAAFSNSFYPEAVTVEQFVTHISNGLAFTCGLFHSNRRAKANFKSSQMLALDLDNGVSVATCLQDSHIRDYSAIVYPTPSSSEKTPKSRVVFFLPQPVTSLELWEHYQQALLYHYRHLQPDPACKDAARLFYGSTLAGAHVNTVAVLPFEILQQFVVGYEQYMALQRAQTRTVAREQITDGSRQAKYAEKAYTDEIADLRSVKVNRNIALFSTACNVFSMVKGGWPGITETAARSDLTDAALATGLPKHEIERTLDSAWNTCTERLLA